MSVFFFYKFKMTIVKNLIIDFEGFYEVLPRHKYFYLHIFGNETTALLIFFEISMEMHFVSLFFLNEKNITTSLLMVHLKCTVVHYAILNPSSMSTPFLNYGPLNMLFYFFDFFVYFNEDFIKNFTKHYHFLIYIS